MFKAHSDKGRLCLSVPWAVLALAPSGSSRPFSAPTCSPGRTHPPLPLARGTSGPLREWATAYAAISVRSAAGAEVIVSPIGAALAVGDDFGAIYPTAQVQLGIARRRFRISSVVRVIRIAGADGSGTYWSQWIPVRIGYALGSWRRIDFDVRYSPRNEPLSPKLRVAGYTEVPYLAVCDLP